MRILQGLKLAAVLAVALSMGACANKNLGADGAMASAATPGSQQDFVVNVGDRVFFESDQTDLSPQAIATLDKQAHWLQTYNRYSFTIEGHADERGTREYNIALGARRAQSVRSFLASRGIDREPDADDLLRQGTPGRGLQRHLVLVAEPPRGHRAERQLLRRSPCKSLSPAPSGAGFVLARTLSAFVYSRLFQSHFWRTPALNGIIVAFDVTQIASSGQNVIQISSNYALPRRSRATAVAVAALRLERRCCRQPRSRNPTMAIRRCGFSSLRTSCGSSPARTRNCSTATSCSRSA